MEERIVTFPTLWSDIVAPEVFNLAITPLGLTDAWLKWEVCYKVITEPIEEWALNPENRPYNPPEPISPTYTHVWPSPLFHDSHPNHTPYPLQQQDDFPEPS